MKRSLFSVMLITALLLTTVFAAASAQQPAAAVRSYLVISATNRLPPGLETNIRNAGGTLTSTVPEIGVAVAESAAPNFAARLARSASIRSVVPNITLQWVEPVTGEVITMDDVGNPPFSGSADFFFDLQWGHTAVEAPAAWAEGYRGAGVRVAVLDTGFDLTHPDLVPNINFALSMNFVAGETLQYGLPDPFSHGTHTAGTIAAAQNDFGTIGVAPDAELVLVKVLGDAGSGTFEDVISGIIYAANVQADVINMSLGGTLFKSGFCDEEGCVTAREVAELKNAVGRATTYAYQRGSTVIVSAGNNALDRDKTANMVVLPADSPNVIQISATAPVGWAVDPLNTFLDNLASYSNYGLSAIHFAAPGGDFVYPGEEACVVAGLLRPCWVFDLVFSTGNQSWYWSAGTSMAAPHASGVAALIIGKNGGSMHPAQVRAALAQSADDLGKPGKDAEYGHGRVNAYQAVR
jgi:lantibiotic leader peptide-processing serine protease